MRNMRNMRRYFSSNIQINQIQLPSSIKLGNNLHYRKNEIIQNNYNNSNKNNNKKLAVVVGWLGAKDSQMKTYLSFYHKHGFDTLSFAVGPKHILYPHDAMNHMKNVWKTALDITRGENQQNPNDIIVHAFSMGGYLFGQSLRCIEKHPEEFNILNSQIKAQIFDSPPDHGSIANGISKSFNVPKILEKPIEGVVKGYLKLTYNTAGVEHRAASQSFHNNTITAPSLWYYSHSDVVANYKDCEVVINKWIKNGIDVKVCKWENSPHIQHGRTDPERYFGELENFLKDNNLILKNTIQENEIEEKSFKHFIDNDLQSESDNSDLEGEKQKKIKV